MTSPDPPCTCAAEDAPRHLHADYCPRHGAPPVLVLRDPTDRGAIRQDAVRVYRDWPNDMRRRLMADLQAANALGDLNGNGARAMVNALRDYFTLYHAVPLHPVAAAPEPAPPASWTHLAQLAERHAREASRMADELTYPPTAALAHAAAAQACAAVSALVGVTVNAPGAKVL